MKRAILVIALLTMALVPYGAYAARQSCTLSGRVTDSETNPVEYATVLLLDKAGNQAAACMTDEKGEFRLTAAAGTYTLKVTFFGCKEYSRQIDLDGELRTEDIVMESDSKMLKEFVVVGNRIVREPDRFVINLEGDASAIGKDSFEVLKTAPGVWISSQDGITINGRSGTQVMINERLLRMSGDQLESYLRNIKAEDIQKIEVIPSSGADFDANSGGGIIKITLKKRREDGIDGSVALSGSYGEHGSYNLSPSGSVNYQSGKLNMYTNLGYSRNNSWYSTSDHTEYFSGAMTGSDSRSESVITGDSDSYNARLGGVYDFTDKHSVGAEFGANVYDSGSRNNSQSVMLFGDPAVMGLESILSTSRFDSDIHTNYYSGTANYLYKIDKKGSTFKVITDYVRNDSKNPVMSSFVMDYISGGVPVISLDSLNSRASKTANDMFSASADYTNVFKQGTSLKVGGKYSFNNMRSDVSAEYKTGNDAVWTDIPSQTLKTDYKENIGALYAIYSSSAGPLSFTVGLRGEYTKIDPRFESARESSDVHKRDYFDIFPNANIMFSLNKKRSNSLIMAYSRNIQRPGFWALNPIRNDLDNYSYTVGNPNLKPSYIDNLSLTGVYKYRYTLTVGAYASRDGVQQVVSRDETNPNVIRYRYENISKAVMYFAALSLPVTITKWWSVNLNLFGMRRNERLYENGEMQRGWMMNFYGATTFTLPSDIDIEVTYWRMSSIKHSNMLIQPMQGLSASIKKRFAQNRFTASISFNNIVQNKQDVRSTGEGFIKTTRLTMSPFSIGASLRYNFKAGIKVRARQVERGTDSGRMGSGNSGGINIGQ